MAVPVLEIQADRQVLVQVELLPWGPQEVLQSELLL